MPELPEVETVRKGLEKCLANFQIDSVEVLRDRAIASPGGASSFTKNLKGCTFGNWNRRGKYLLSKLYEAQLNPDSSIKSLIDRGAIGIHLRMTGYFQWNPKSCIPCKHTRVRFWNQQRQELRFIDIRSFGQMWWVPPGESPEKIITGLSKLGPEPFSKAFNSTYLQNKLRGSKRPIKSTLLDQSVVAGPGNIYSDESLFLAKINPHTQSGLLSKVQLKRLHESLVEVLRLSIGVGGTTFSDFRDLQGSNGNYGGQAWVYRRGGYPCKICGEKVIRDVIGGRSSHWCPKCQS